MFALARQIIRILGNKFEWKRYMNQIQKQTQNAKEFLVDHPKLKKWLLWIGITLVEMISGFIFAFGFKAFINPPSGTVEIWMEQEALKIKNAMDKGITIYPKITQYDVLSPNHLISGGASGFSQVIVKFISIFVNLSAVSPSIDLESLLISLLYFCVNIPLFVFSWFKITKQFTFFTFLNVLFTSLFIQIIPDEFIGMMVNLYSDALARSMFGGLTTGIASGLAMLVGSCGGGSDILSIYFSEKKSTSVGKFFLVFNMTIVLLYVFFSVIGHSLHPEWNTQDNASVITLALYTVVYSFVTSKTLDFINQKNKKVEMQIFTSDDNLPLILVRAFPHSATTVESKGAFSGKKNYMVYMVLSKSEEKKAAKLIKKADPKAFFTTLELSQVYGRFHMKPLDL